MALQTLNLFQFRNYSKLTLEFPSQGALFYGKNGVGKTNLFEAISLVTLGKSVRQASLKDMIQKGKNESYVSGTFLNNKIELKQSVGFSRKKKIEVIKDGLLSTQLSKLYDKKRFIYFGPNDLLLVTGIPEEKRRFIDQIISQKYPEYLFALMAYKKIIKERNALLTNTIDRALLLIYHQKIAHYGVQIQQKRKYFFQEIAELFAYTYQSIGQGDLCVEIVYQPSITPSSEQEYEHLLSESIEKDKELGYTSIGIHRDSFTFRVNNNKLVGFGSQGQMRSVALSFKSAALSYLKKKSSSLVMVAVDDAFSDLDAERRVAFFEHLQEQCQLFIALHSEQEADQYQLPLFMVTEGKVVLNG